MFDDGATLNNLTPLLPRPMSNDTPMTSTSPSLEKENTMTDWQQAELLAKNAFVNGDYDAVIDHSSGTVDDLQKRLVYLLKMRMVAWARKGQHKRELDEASTIIQYAPHDPAGYMCMGHRYADQGHQTKAIKVFDNGLRNVPQSDNQYKALYDGKQRAMERRNQRIDIIAKVPFDVMGIIVDQIPARSLVSCIKVSSVWRQKLLEYPRCWRTIRIEDIDGVDVPARMWYVLPLVSHHVRELSLPHAPQLPGYLKLISTKCFTNLQSFQIRNPISRSLLCALSVSINLQHYIKENKHGFEDYCELFHECLPNIGSTLTSLDIHFFGDCISLSLILNACRNLTEIGIYDNGEGPTFSGLVLSFKTLLKKVVLQTVYTTLQTSELVPLFQCSPVIQYLALKGCEDDMYTAVSENCSSIKVLKIGHGPQRMDDFVDVYPGSHSGLTSLSAYYLTSRLPLMPLIDKHSSTLCSLHVKFPMSIGFIRQQESWDNLSSLALNGLVRLYLENVPKAIVNDLPRLLERCSKLKTIYLNNVHGRIPDAAFLALSNLRKLNSLQLQYARFLEQSILRFLHSVQRPRNDGHGLTKLRLYVDGNIADAVLLACAAVENLSYLAICCTTKMTANNEQTFSAGLSRLPRLRKLHLSNMKLSEQSLLHIGQNNNLKEVQLNNIYYLTAVQIQDAFAPHIVLKFTEYTA
ncbi:hypothetical protein BJV82DRAFT_594626 [Fennellomyces sp. T-0311]|nr:hypothetical protein BJV82DRAFT_594626 [Fennellomyces sp. T-0311]